MPGTMIACKEWAKPLRTRKCSIVLSGTALARPDGDALAGTADAEARNRNCAPSFSLLVAGHEVAALGHRVRDTCRARVRESRLKALGDDEGATTSREVREMAETPWQSYSHAAPERDYVALLSYLPLSSAWSRPRLVLYSTRIQRQLRTSSGLIGYSLRARIAAKQFWTLSVWEDAADLQAFVAAPPHVAVMKAMAPHMGATRFVRWNVKGSELPLRWDDALRRD